MFDIPSVVEEMIESRDAHHDNCAFDITAFEKRSPFVVEPGNRDTRNARYLTDDIDREDYIDALAIGEL